MKRKVNQKKYEPNPAIPLETNLRMPSNDARNKGKLVLYHQKIHTLEKYH
jgi:hypothetical protein